MNKKERKERERKRQRELKKRENELRESGFRHIGGVDEAGRGPLAGPVYAACVVLPDDFDVPGIDDSKKLSAKRRDELAEQIRGCADAIGVGIAMASEIDEINILNATKNAMRRAVRKANEDLAEKAHLNIFDDVDGARKPHIDKLLIDALCIDGEETDQEAIIKGDSTCLCIAAASIIAKVERDAYMRMMDAEYPGYGFASNKGYGTKAHYEGIASLGITPIHRKTFLKTANRNIAKIRSERKVDGKMKKKFYAIKNGRKTGIVNTWEECRVLVEGFKGAEFKGFSTIDAAEEYMGCAKNNDGKGIEAYVDGSYDQDTAMYSCGVVIVNDGKAIDKIAKRYDDPSNAELRNVAGEIMGARLAIMYCLEHDIKEVSIYHDYAGIGKWGDGEWKANLDMTKDYKSFVAEARKTVKIHFVKVDAHSGVHYNEMADKLAGDVLK